MKKSFAFVILAVGLMAMGVVAEEAAKPEAKHATFDGQLVCLGCDLKKAEGARSACKVYGCNHVLKTSDGQYINFLQNDFSKELSSDKHHNKAATVSGMFHASANTLDVESFTVEGGKKQGWCDHCKTMDNCPFKGHGNM